MKITNFKILKQLPLAEKDSKSYYKKEPCYICTKKFYGDIKIFRKVQDHDHYSWVMSIFYAI